MPPIRVPAAAMPALRARIEQFLRTNGVIAGRDLVDVEFDSITLAGFLLAALRYTREEHPWLGRQGVILEPPEKNSFEAALELSSALNFYTALEENTLDVDACITALKGFINFEIIDEPCGRRRPRPEPYLWPLESEPEVLRRCDISLRERVFGVVAEDGWVQRAPYRDEVFQAVLPQNHEPLSYVELDFETARLLTQYLLAGPKRTEARKAYRAHAEAFVRLFGKGTRAFAPRGLDIDEDHNPFTRGAAWSCYDNTGTIGSWASTASVVVSDGLRVAFIEVLWDITSE